METVKLANSLEIPRVGLGTWQITDREILVPLLRDAFDIGYSLIDTAAAYSNEMAIGKSLLELGKKRNEIFLANKVWNTSRGFEAVQEACKKSLKKLKTDYLDLYLIHWPASPKLHENWRELNADTWHGMEELYKNGFVRAIGVCNFKTHHLEELKKSASIMPMINQFEFHPGMNNANNLELIKYCKENKIALEASSPLGNGQILSNETLSEIAKSKSKTTAQLCLRYALQKDFVVIPKTTSKERLISNIDVFDFSLSDDEIKLIDSIPYCGGIGLDSDEVVQFG